VPAKIYTLDFCFENSPTKIVANRNFPELKLAGLTVGPFDEGNEYEVHYWIAKELEASGIVHLREEETLDPAKLYKAQWKEGVQIPGQISELPQDFYPKLRRYLALTKEEVTKQPEKITELEKAKHLARDIVNSRLKKIVALSSTSGQTDQVLKKLTSEEKLIYDQLGKIISNWKTQILKCEKNGGS
jgi:DNA replication factor GINS